MTTQATRSEIAQALAKAIAYRTITPTTPREFASAIKGAWQHGTEHILQTAELYRVARRELGDMGWTELLRDVPHSDSTARKMALIGEWWARTPVTSDMLPPHWGTLYALSCVPDDVLRTAASQGKVHPGMERKDAEALVPKKAGKATQAQAASSPVPTLASSVPGAVTPSLGAACDMLLALRDAGQPASYAGDVPRTRLALALAFLTAVHRVAK